MTTKINTKDLTDNLKTRGYSNNSLDLARDLTSAYSSRYPDDTHGKVIDNILISVGLDKLVKGIKGKSILDIGCGCSRLDSPDFVDTYHDYMGNLINPWLPRLSRILSLAGANVTGIDKGFSDGTDNYDHITADLTLGNLGDLVANNKFDLVVAKAFFDSPSLLKDVRAKITFPYTFVRAILKDIYSVIKKDGIFLSNYRDMLDLASNYGLDSNFFDKDGLDYLLDSIGFVKSDGLDRLDIFRTGGKTK